MQYRLLPREAAKHLSNKEIYVYLALLFKSDYRTGVSNVVQETLSELTKYPTETVSDYLKKARKSELIEIDIKPAGQTENGRPKERNTYYSKIPTSDFIMVQKELLDLNINDLPAKEQSGIKGFLLLVKCICLNNSNKTLYSLRKIAENISLSYSTIFGLMKKCKDLGLIIDNPDGTGYIITGNYFDIGNKEFTYPSNTPKAYKLIYEEIYYFLIRKGQEKPPAYDKKYISKLATRYYPSQIFKEHPNISNMLNLIVELENRLPQIKEPINSLNYICKALLGEIVEAELENEETIIL